MAESIQMATLVLCSTQKCTSTLNEEVQGPWKAQHPSVAELDCLYLLNAYTWGFCLSPWSVAQKAHFDTVVQAVSAMSNIRRLRNAWKGNTRQQCFRVSYLGDSPLHGEKQMIPLTLPCAPHGLLAEHVRM